MKEILIEIRDILQYQTKLLETLVESEPPNPPDPTVVLDGIKDMLSKGPAGDITGKILDSALKMNFKNNEKGGKS